MFSKFSQKTNLDPLDVESLAFLDKLQMWINGIKLECWILWNLSLMRFKINSIATSALYNVRVFRANDLQVLGWYWFWSTVYPKWILYWIYILFIRRQWLCFSNKLSVAPVKKLVLYSLLQVLAWIAFYTDCHFRPVRLSAWTKACIL